MAVTSVSRGYHSKFKIKKMVIKFIQCVSLQFTELNKITISNILFRGEESDFNTSSSKSRILGRCGRDGGGWLELYWNYDLWHGR